MKISTFDNGSIRTHSQDVVIQLGDTHSAFTDGEIQQAEDLYHHAPYSLPLEKMVTEQERFEIHLQAPPGFLNSQAIRKEALPVRLAMAYHVLQAHPLNESHYVSIHPSTLFFRPMSQVLFAYVATKAMPTENNDTTLQQYKALTYSLITNQPYESFLVHGDQAFKERRHLFAKRESSEVTKLVEVIKEADSYQELCKDIEDFLEYAQFHYFQEVDKTERNTSKKLIFISSLSFILLLIAIGTVQVWNHSQETALANQYEQELSQKNMEVSILQDVNKENYEAAVSTMKEQNVEETEITDWLVEEGQYQAALDRHPSDKTVTTIVNKLYDAEKEEQINDLQAASSQLLEDEQNIVAYNADYLNNRATLVENEDTALRMGHVFVENSNISSAQTIADRFESEDLEQAITEKEQESFSSQLQEEKIELEEERSELEEDDNEGNSEAIEDLNDQIRAKQEEIDDLD